VENSQWCYFFVVKYLNGIDIMCIFVVPKEIEKRGKEIIAKFVADLRKGKVKMPHCKLMILGEAGVGKTSLLSLLTGEPFNPEHNETEGVDINFVCTSTICSDTWKKKAMERVDEYKDVAAQQLAQVLPDKEQPMKHEKKQVNVSTHASLKQQFESLVKKYSEQKESIVQPKPKSKPVHAVSYSHHQPSVQHNPSRLPLTYLPSAFPPVTTSSFIGLHPLTAIRAEPPHVKTFVPEPHPVTTTHSISTSTLRQETSKKDTTTPSQEQLPSHTKTSTDPGHVQTDIVHRAAKLKKLKSSDKKIELPLKFSSFDFAGQKHYKPMHHCFITSRAVYIIAFNVRHLLLNNEQKYRCIQELKFWANSICIYTDDDAKMVFVGTHRGPYAGSNGNDQLVQVTQEQEETIQKIMNENFCNECYIPRISLFKDDKLFTMVENSIRSDEEQDDREDGSGTSIIRKKLFQLGDRYPGNNDDLPISYLRLEQKIFEERKNNSLIFREEVEGWAREFGIDDPTVALTFFHDVGTIIDPSKSLSLFPCHHHTLQLL